MIPENHMSSRNAIKPSTKFIVSALTLLLILTLFGNFIAIAATPTPNKVEAVARTLYCPLCVGQRLDACEIPLCIDMKREIAEQLAQGRTPEEIRQYFVAQYGPVVLGEPPRKGFNWLAWVIPFLVLAGAAAFVLIRVRQWSSAQPATAGGTGPEGTAGTEPEEDEYTRQVERELAEWE